MNRGGRPCPGCGQPVIWARTEAMKWQALNPEPDPAGNVHAYPGQLGNWLARSVPPGTPAVPPDRLMMPHAATCTRRNEKPAPAAANVTSLDQWRKAAAAHSRKQRRRRPGPQPGYRPGMNTRQPPT